MPIAECLNYEVIDDQGRDLYEEENFERAAESDGQRWPFSCRDGICSNCAAVIISGEIEIATGRFGDIQFGSG